MVIKNLFQNLQLVNWNADGIKIKRATTIDFLQRHNIDVACISETHLIPVENFKIPGYNIIRNDRNAPFASGGVLILVKKSLKYHEIILPQLINLEATAVNLTMRNNKKIKIIAAYQPPSKRIMEEDITTIFRENTPTLLLGDLNSKNTVWECRATNPNGQRLQKIISTYASIKIATPTDPTYFPQ